MITLPVHARTAALVTVMFFFSPDVLRAQVGRAGPDSGRIVADSLFQSGSYAMAARAYESLLKRSPDNPQDWTRLAMSAYHNEDFAKAAQAFETAVAKGAGPRAMYNAGATHARLGHVDQAFRWLFKADSAGLGMLSLLAGDDDISSLRTDSRFSALLASARKTAFPCESDSDSQRMSFWIGDWDVKNARGEAAGTSSVQSISGGCGIYENWSDSQGGTGKSLSAWNRSRREWQQFWIGQRGAVTEYRQGQWKDGSMVFLAESSGVSGANAPVRMTFTPKGPDLVRQLFESSTDGGATWRVQADFLYHRRKK